MSIPFIKELLNKPGTQRITLSLLFMTLRMKIPTLRQTYLKGIDVLVSIDGRFESQVFLDTGLKLWVHFGFQSRAVWVSSLSQIFRVLIDFRLESKLLRMLLFHQLCYNLFPLNIFSRPSLNFLAQVLFWPLLHDQLWSQIQFGVEDVVTVKLGLQRISSFLLSPEMGFLSVQEFSSPVCKGNSWSLISRHELSGFILNGLILPLILILNSLKSIVL